MISATTALENELPNLLHKLPTICLFDLTIKLDHLLGDPMWWSPLNHIGFEVYADFQMLLPVSVSKRKLMQKIYSEVSAVLSVSNSVHQTSFPTMI